jgi:hypothetical protein
MYSRTQNDNGTYNTRCLDCFMTIASCVETEKELDMLEAHHVCPEKALHELMEQERALEEHGAHR